MKERRRPISRSGARHELILAEEELSDVSLATFFVFDKENTAVFRPNIQFARGCGGGCGGGGCRAAEAAGADALGAAVVAESMAAVAVGAAVGMHADCLVGTLRHWLRCRWLLPILGRLPLLLSGIVSIAT